jgi:hypothetical protein
MKQSPKGDIQEINSSKLKINISRSYNTDTNNPSLINKLNLENKAQPKRIQNNINLGNNDLNTSNTNENVPSMSKSLLQKLVDKADKLEIEIINSLSENSNSTIEINSLGMAQGSKRKAKDGITYFGLIDEDNSYIDTNNNNQDVDYIINTNEIINEENNNLLGRHFRIRFDINTMKYYIKDLGRGFGTFKKIINKAKIKDSYLLNIGNSYIVCTFGVDEYYQEGMGIEDGDKTLNIKVFSEIPQTEPHFFNPKQFKRVYIGRDISCNIIVDDSLLSRVHCTIEYNDEEGWVIYDGKINDDESKNKPSTNGTWLYLIEEIPIEEGLIFKNNKNAFECHIIHQNKKE